MSGFMDMRGDELNMGSASGRILYTAEYEVGLSAWRWHEPIGTATFGAEYGAGIARSNTRLVVSTRDNTVDPDEWHVEVIVLDGEVKGWSCHVPVVGGFGAASSPAPRGRLPVDIVDGDTALIGGNGSAHVMRVVSP